MTLLGIVTTRAATKQLEMLGYARLGQELTGLILTTFDILTLIEWHCLAFWQEGLPDTWNACSFPRNPFCPKPKRRRQPKSPEKGCPASVWKGTLVWNVHRYSKHVKKQKLRNNVWKRLCPTPLGKRTYPMVRARLTFHITFAQPLNFRFADIGCTICVMSGVT